MKVTDSTEASFVLAVLSYTQGVRNFLANNPFIVKEGEGLAGSFFSDGGSLSSQSDVKSIFHDYYIDGLSHLTIASLDDRPLSDELIPPELKRKIAIAH